MLHRVVTALMVLLIGCAPRPPPPAEVPKLAPRPDAIAPVRCIMTEEVALLFDPTAARVVASGYFPNWYAASHGSLSDTLLGFLRAAGEPSLLGAPPDELDVRITISPSFHRPMVIRVRGIASGASLVATLFDGGCTCAQGLRKHRLPEGDVRRRWLAPADWWRVVDIVRATSIDSLPPTLSFETLMGMTDGVMVFVEVAERGRYSVVTLYGIDAAGPLIEALTALAGAEFSLPWFKAAGR